MRRARRPVETPSSKFSRRDAGFEQTTAPKPRVLLQSRDFGVPTTGWAPGVGAGEGAGGSRGAGRHPAGPSPPPGRSPGAPSVPRSGGCYSRAFVCVLGPAMARKNGRGGACGPGAGRGRGPPRAGVGGGAPGDRRGLSRGRYGGAFGPDGVKFRIQHPVSPVFGPIWS